VSTHSSRSTRDRILDAAAHVMLTEGFAATTTKGIAREAALSEGTLYKHFTDKSELFLAVLLERLPAAGPFLSALTDSAGPPRDWLVTVARAAIGFYTGAFPMSASVFSDPSLLAAHRAAMTKLDAGPHRPLAALTQSLRERQQRGEVAGNVDCAAAADLLLGACFQRGFLAAFEQRAPDSAEIAAHAEAITDTLIAGLRAG
jgi:AcrR family transcriptional regulator